MAQANAPIDAQGCFLHDRIKAPFKGEFPVVS
ncbi:hypothetical protein DRQ00_09235, partial [candidate division KSB1 bacterium]